MKKDVSLSSMLSFIVNEINQFRKSSSFEDQLYKHTSITSILITLLMSINCVTNHVLSILIGIITSSRPINECIFSHSACSYLLKCFILLSDYRNGDYCLSVTDLRTLGTNSARSIIGANVTCQ